MLVGKRTLSKRFSIISNLYVMTYYDCLSVVFLFNGFIPVSCKILLQLRNVKVKYLLSPQMNINHSLYYKFPGVARLILENKKQKIVQRHGQVVRVPPAYHMVGDIITWEVHVVRTCATLHLAVADAATPLGIDGVGSSPTRRRRFERRRRSSCTTCWVNTDIAADPMM